jgi:hypothetical protein
MIVVMTSWAPVTALRTPGIAPASAPPAIPAKMQRIQCHGDGTDTSTATYAAQTAPSVTWLAPPMLKIPVSKPIPTPRPAMMSGVAATRVWEIGVAVITQSWPVVMECQSCGGFTMAPSNRAR